MHLKFSSRSNCSFPKEAISSLFCLFWDYLISVPGRSLQSFHKGSLPFKLFLLITFIAFPLTLYALPQLSRFPHEARAQTTAASLSGIHVSGNVLVNDQGQTVVLRGVNRSGTEYACIQGWGIFDGPNDAASIQAMRTWGINAVNILLNEDCWLGINGVSSAYGGTNYQQAIANYIQLLESYSIYPILSYTWGAPGTQQATGQASMPDADHAAAFWQSVANTFKGDQAVLFRLKEEPYPAGNSDTTAAWQCWRNGGSSCNEGYSVVGMQSLINTIRATGATNVIQVPGIQYANTMTQFLNYKPTDSLNNLMGVVDVYPGGSSPADTSTCGTTTCYDAEYAPIIAQMPFLVGEFGESVNGDVCSVMNSNILMNWMDQHNTGYLAWTWDTWGTSCGDLSLITSYDGTPHSPNGTNYKGHLAAIVTPAPTPTSTTLPTPTSTPTSTPTPIPTTTPTSTVGASLNIIQNGSFDNGSLLPWYLQVRSGASGTVALDSTTKIDGMYSAKVNVTTSNSQNYGDIQLIQDNVPLIQGSTYSVTFWAKASKKGYGELVVQQDSSPWTVYFDKSFLMKTSWAEYSYTFISSVSLSYAEFNFNLAQRTGQVWIDGVSMHS